MLNSLKKKLKYKNQLKLSLILFATEYLLK